MYLHSLPRVAGSSTASTMATRSAVRSFKTSTRQLAPAFTATQQPPMTSQSRQSVRAAHAISNPTLAGIEKRWEGMPPQEQAELWMQLRDRMKVDWNEMTLQEKKAGTCGPHLDITIRLSPQGEHPIIRAHLSMTDSTENAANENLKLTIMFYSLVDCLRTSRTSCREPTR